MVGLRSSGKSRPCCCTQASSSKLAGFWICRLEAARLGSSKPVWMKVQAFSLKLLTFFILKINTDTLPLMCLSAMLILWQLCKFVAFMECELQCSSCTCSKRFQGSLGYVVKCKCHSFKSVEKEILERCLHKAAYRSTLYGISDTQKNA